jgi:hypothetical protein
MNELVGEHVKWIAVDYVSEYLIGNSEEKKCNKNSKLRSGIQSVMFWHFCLGVKPPHGLKTRFFAHHELQL